MVMVMEPDRDKILGYLFEPPSSDIMALLEDGPQELDHISKETGLAGSEVESALSYLVECGLVNRVDQDGTITYSADTQRLAKIVEDDENFDSAIDGLTKMDSYLN